MIRRWSPNKINPAVTILFFGRRIGRKKKKTASISFSIKPTRDKTEILIRLHEKIVCLSKKVEVNNLVFPLLISENKQKAKAMINLNNVHKSYVMGNNKLHVLKGIDLHIEQGDFVSIMGSSGSGKSTLLNILGMLDNYDEGSYYLNGTLIANMSEKKAAQYRNEMVGFVFQSFNLISFKNAMENVALPLYYKGVSRKKRNLMAMEYLDKLGLREWAGHMPNEMSGGQKQRVAIARALIAQPKIILADEPTGALDTATSYEVMEILKEINGDGITVIIVTHEHDIAAMTRQIVRLKDGLIHEIIRNGELKEFRHAYMKELETV
jgi:putative ABC transport system ATP-binding protein